MRRRPVGRNPDTRRPVRWCLRMLIIVVPLVAVTGLAVPRVLARTTTAPVSSLSCDVYGHYGTRCVAAYSMDRALYSSYDGPLYQVQRASDDTTADIGLLSRGGYVDASRQDSFCANTACTI